MNAEPLLSGQCAAYLLLAVLLGVGFLGAVVALSIHIRQAIVGNMLLRACGGDYQTAMLAIDNVRAEAELLAQAWRERDEFIARNKQP